MQLPKVEADAVGRRTAEIDKVIAECRSHPWHRRTRAVLAGLENLHHAWWDVHDANADAYERDLARLNKLAVWKNYPPKKPGDRPKEYAQVTHVERENKRFLAPPKFFGGDPTRLAERFVLAISLNHATPRNSAGYVTELRAWQQRDTCFASHRDYFVSGHVHGTFFAPRAVLLRSYLRVAGERDVPDDDRHLNQRYSLYLESYPTHSPNSGASRLPNTVLEQEVFVMALNELARRLVLELLRPTAVLIAGHDAKLLLPPRAPVPAFTVLPGRDVTVDELTTGHEVVPCRIVRCGPLKSQFGTGPKTDGEIAKVGELLGEPGAYARLINEQKNTVVAAGTAAGTLPSAAAVDDTDLPDWLLEIISKS
jgi:hypothetical protein